MANVTNKKVIADRLKSLRSDMKMSQSEVARNISLTLGLKDRIANSTISAWEVGAKTPSFSYLIALANLYNVSTDYLLGVSQNPSGGSEFEFNMADYVKEIKMKDLPKYDGLPVLLSYSNSNRSDVWGIYDREHECFYCKGKVVKVSSIDKCYATLQSSFPPRPDDNKKLSLAACKQMDEVWIEYRGIDNVISDRFSGWFNVNASEKYFINGTGNILPFRGLNINYYAYPNKPNIKK